MNAEIRARVRYIVRVNVKLYLGAGYKVEEEDPGGEEDAEHCQRHVSIQLMRYHLK